MVNSRKVKPLIAGPLWREAPLLLGLAVVLAAGSWFARTPRLPLIADMSLYEMDLAAPVLEPAEALAAFRDNTHIFVDTRAVDDGRRIPGAMVLRPDSFDEDFREIYDFLVPEDALILYGDGNLMLTSNVAQQLEARGFTELSLLRGDLDAWAAAGGDLSTEGGAP